MNWSVSLQGSAKGRRGTVKRGTMFKLILCTLAVSYVSAAPVSVDNIGVNTTTVIAQPVCKDSHPGGNPRKCDLTCFSECCLGADDHDQAWLSECIDTSCGCAGFPSESCVCPTCNVTPGQSCQEDRDCDRAPGCGQWQCFFGTHHNGGCAGPSPTPPPAPPTHCAGRCQSDADCRSHGPGCDSFKCSPLIAACYHASESSSELPTTASDKAVGNWTKK